MGYAGSNYEQGIAPESGSIAGPGSYVGVNVDGEFVLTSSAGGGGADPAGSDRQIQFNDGGSDLGASANLVFTAANALAVTGSIHISGSGANKLVIEKAPGDSTKEIVFTEDGVDQGGIYFNNSDHLFIRNENDGKDIIIRVENPSNAGRNLIRLAGTSEGVIVGHGDGTKTVAYAELDVNGDAIVSGNVTLGDSGADSTLLNSRLTASQGGLFNEHIYLVDDKNLIFGSDGDAVILYDEATTNRLIISGSTAGISLGGGSIALDYGAGKTINSGTLAGDGSYIGLAADNTLVLASAGGGSSPAGSDTQVQFNEGGSALGASANLTWDDTNLNAKAFVGGTTAATLTAHAGEFSTLSSFNSSSAKYTTQYDGVGKLQGTVISLGNATTVANNLYYLNDGGCFEQAKGDDDDTGATQLMAIALSTNSTTHGMLINGMIRVTGSLVDDTMTIGAPVFMSKATAGGYSFTAPTGSEEIVRRVGYCLDINTHGASSQQMDMLLLFAPSDTYIELA